MIVNKKKNGVDYYRKLKEFRAPLKVYIKYEEKSMPEQNKLPWKKEIEMKQEANDHH